MSASTGRKISNTPEYARHPWPPDVFVQGGARGLVLVHDGPDYRTAFVEAFPHGTFLRGEGKTIADAEDACWAKYRLYLTCDGSAQHGPYDPGRYENGVGHCVKCGTSFSGVCEPSASHLLERQACDDVQARYGPNVVLTTKWHGLVEDRKNQLRAERDGEPHPESTTEPPTEAELRVAAEPVDFRDVAHLLDSLVNRTGEVPERGAD